MALAWLSMATLAPAQEAPAAVAPETGAAEAQSAVAAEPSAGALPAGPDTTIWIDDDGVPRPLVGMSYEDLMQLLREREGLGAVDQTPPFIREAFQATGAIQNDRVVLKARYVLTLTQSGRVVAPLGFSTGVLSAPPRIESGRDKPAAEQAAGDGGPSQFIFFDPEQGGFVATLDGAAGDRRVIELPLLLPLERDSLQTLLRANIPRANRSSIALDSATPLIDPFAAEGAIVDSEPTDAGGMRLKVFGAVGDFRLGWRVASERPTTRQRTVLSVVGHIFCDIDGRRVRSRAALAINTYGGGVERFRVRLPIGATLLPAAEDAVNAGVRVTPLPAEPDSAGAMRPMCLVTLAERTSEPLAVVIETEQAVGAGDLPDVDLAGFEVVGAGRQDGDCAIRIAEDWRLRWGTIEGAERIDVAALPDSLRQPGVSAAVRYTSQPWKLGVEVVRLGTRIEATPRYRLEIGADAAVLKTSIDYRIPGARVSSFAIDLGDWTRLTDLPPVRPAELVDADLVSVTETEEGDSYRMYVPLLRPVSQQARIEFTARIDLDAADGPLSFRLPTAEATTQGASELIVVVDPSVQLIPDASRIKRLRAAPLPEDARDEDDPTGVRTFRFVGFLPNQVFAANKRLRPGELDATAHADVEVGDEQTRIVQNFEYEARYQPVTGIVFSAPAELAESESLQFTLLASPSAGGFEPIASTGDGVLLPHRVGSQVVDEDGRVEVLVDLPQPWLGRFRVQSTHNKPAGLVDLSLGRAIEFNLLRCGSRLASSPTATATATDGRRLSLVLDRGGWSTTDAADSGAGQLNAVATGDGERLALTQFREQTPRMADAVLRQAWWQTWLTSEKIQQRAAFLFESRSRDVSVELPEMVVGAPVEVVLNGQPLRGYSRTGSRIVVPLPAASADSHTLEVRYFEPLQESVDAAPWRPARLIANDRLAASYWEVILPRQQQLLTAPPGFASAMRWGLESGVWGNRPLLQTAELESWAGARALGLPSDVERRHLFSAYGAAPSDNESAVPIIGRATVVSVCSALVLAMGVLLIYVPWLRSGPCLFGLAVAVVAIGVSYASTFVFVVHAGFLGLLLGALAATLAAVLRSPPLSEATLSGSSVDVAPQTLGSDTYIAAPLGSVSTNAPTVSIPPNDSQG